MGCDRGRAASGVVQAARKECCAQAPVSPCEALAVSSLASACWSVVIVAASRCLVEMVLHVWLRVLHRFGVSFPQAVAFGESKFLHDMLARSVSRFSSGIGCFGGVEV